MPPQSVLSPPPSANGTTPIAARAASVVPGQTAAVELPVRNTGNVVDEFSLEVLGEAASWAELEPSSIRLFPGTSGVAKVVFRPPRQADVHPGEVPFAVRITSKEDPAQTVVEEGLLTVGPFTDTAAELLPTAAHGRLRAKYRIAVDNRGNVPLTAALAASDPTGELTFNLCPAAAEAAPGTAAFSRLEAAPRKTLWWGRAKPPKQFQVSVKPVDQAPITLTGAMVQEPFIPRWAAMIAIGLIGLLVAGVVLWTALLKPAIASAAKQAGQQAAQAAVAGPLAKQQAQLKKQDDAVKQQGDKIAALQSGNPPPSANPSGTASNSLGDPFDGRLNSKTPDLAVSKGTLSVTDIFFENPNGATGMLRLVRDPGDGSPSRDLKVERLDNFRDLDIHFVSPITLSQGQKLRVIFDGCQNGPGSPSGQPCSASVYFTGFQKG